MGLELAASGGQLLGIMRQIVLALCIALAPLAAVAADWGRYVNERFGVAVDVPPGFAAGEPPANGDGLSFATPTARLAVFGSLLFARDFEAEVRQRIEWAEAEGWAITYQASTPSWASWSGQRGSRILYARAEPICGGDAIGAFEFTYSSADRAAFDPVVNRLVRSLGDSGQGWQC